MSKKKKVFIIVYVIALTTIITFMLNKIFATADATSSSGTTDIGSYAGVKTTETASPYREVTPGNRDGIDFSNTNRTAVLNWARGTSDKVPKITWELLTGTTNADNSVFCLNKSKRLLNKNNVTNQYIRKGAATVEGHKNGADYLTVGINDTYYPKDQTYLPASSWPNGVAPSTPLSSLVFNWNNLDATRKTTTDGSISIAEAYIFANRDRALTKDDGTYSRAQYALWSVRNGQSIEDAINDTTNDDMDENQKNIKEHKNTITENQTKIEEIGNKYGLLDNSDVYEKLIDNIEVTQGYFTQNLGEYTPDQLPDGRYDELSYLIGNLNIYIDAIKVELNDEDPDIYYLVEAIKNINDTLNDYHNTYYYNDAGTKEKNFSNVCSWLMTNINLIINENGGYVYEAITIKEYTKKINEAENNQKTFQDKLDNVKSDAQNDTGDGLEGPSSSDIIKSATELINKAKAFAQYREEFKVPSLPSENDEYKFKYVNQDGGYFLAGPITVTYSPLVTSEGDTVGQIVGGKLTGKDKDGNKIEEIPFNFANADGSTMEAWPTAGGNVPFYIRVENSEIKARKVKTIVDFTLKFKYLNVEADGWEIHDSADKKNNVLNYYYWNVDEQIQATSGKCYFVCYHQNCNKYNEKQYISYCPPDYSATGECTGTDCIDCHGGSSHGSCTGGYWVQHGYTTSDGTFISYHDKKYRLRRDTDPNDSTEIQPMFICGNAKMFWEFYELKITFKDELPTYIDLGGKVWVDNLIDNGKVINEENGKFDNAEWGRENVLVELFFFDGADGTPVQVGVNDTLEDERNPEFGDNPYAVYTDENGEYMFYGLPIDQKYFVRFTYDGHTYEQTIYLAPRGKEDDDVAEEAYKNNPNGEEYNINSKVKTDNEAETPRQAFNERFREIKYLDDMPKRGHDTNTGTLKGKAISATDFIEYLTKKYSDSTGTYYKSKIITTDNRTDAEYGETGGPDKQTGKAIDPFKITSRTPETLRYPFEYDKDGKCVEDGGEILIWDTNTDTTEGKGPLTYLKHINLGLKIRPRADFQLTTQLKAGATTIKDKEKVVIYPQSAKKENLDKDMDFTRQEDEYIKQEISAADYNWRTQFNKIYGDGEPIDGTGATGYVVDKDKLHVYVLYKISIRNQCEDAGDSGIINEIIDYYDNRLERVEGDKLERAYKLFKDAMFKEITTPNKACESWIDGTDKAVNWASSSTAGNYQMMKSTGTIDSTGATDEIKVAADDSETSIYLILKVKDTDSVLDGKTITNGRLETGTNDTNKDQTIEDGKDGMQNIAEIGSYTVKNGDKVVGKIDKDSAPGNATPGNKATYEDDTDASPMFRLEINWTPKEITGYVWDDSYLDKEVDGQLTDKEKLTSGVNDVTVKLVEHIVKDGKVIAEVERPGIDIVGKTLSVNPTQSIKTGHTGNKGEYRFYVEGGNYSLKFIYGNQEMLETNKKYNAQDYQALNHSNYKALSSGDVPGYNQTQIKAFATEEALESALKNLDLPIVDVGGVADKEKDDLLWWNTNWNISDIFSNANSQTKEEYNKWGVKDAKKNNYSNVRDRATIRKDVIWNAHELTYSNANKLDKLNGDGGVSREDAIYLSGGNIAKSGQDYKANGNYTYMESVSDIITIASNDLITTPNVINFGLQKRPTASRKLEKKVDRIILTASDGTVLVDTADNTKQSGLQKLDGIQQTFINLEPALMDGALLDIYYTLTVTNDSEANDCLDNYVYVENGTVDSGHLRNDDKAVMTKLGSDLGGYDLKTPLPIKAEIFDYVNINLEYRADDNKYDTPYGDNQEIWTRVYEESGNTGNSTNEIKDGWLSDEENENGISPKTAIKRSNRKVSKVLQTNTDKVVSKYKGDTISGSATEGLLAGESVNIQIHLGITLSEDTSGKNLNDFDFSNCAEMVKVTTTAGRRDYETIPGDYVPYDKLSKENPNEDKQADAFLTGTTAITPPLGEGRFYYVIAIVSASIILVGIVLIKKKVLKK